MRVGTRVLLGLAVWASVSDGARADSTLPSAFDRLAEDFTASWPRFDRPGIEVRATDPSLVTPAALDALASFVDSCAVSLGLSETQRSSLEARPIRYYLCQDVHEVHFLSGVATEGVALAPYRAIVSRWLPHEHEVVHLLAHIAVGEPDLAFEPVLQEGLASLLGGRAGEAASVVLTQADEYLDPERLSPHALWGAQRFQTIPYGNAIAYAVSAQLVGFLIDRMGMPAFLRFYRLLAATPDEIQRRPRSWVLDQLEGATGASWTDLSRDFRAWRSTQSWHGLEPAETGPDSLPALEASDGQRVVRVWSLPDGAVHVTLLGRGRNPEGLLQWGTNLPDGFTSRLRSRHSASARRRYGIWLGSSHTEVYDYLLDKRLAVLRPPLRPVWGMSDGTRASISVRLSPGVMRSIPVPREIEFTAPPTLLE